MVKVIQWSLYFKTTHGPIEMWSYIAGVSRVQYYTKNELWDQIKVVF